MLKKSLEKRNKNSINLNFLQFHSLVKKVINDIKKIVHLKNVMNQLTMKFKIWLHLKFLSIKSFCEKKTEIKKTKYNQIGNRVQKLIEKKRLFYQKKCDFNANLKTKFFFEAVGDIEGKN